MPEQSLAIRVEKLERVVSRLEELPDRMTALALQFVEFRGEVRMEFSAVREEMQGLRESQDESRTEMRESLKEFRTEMRESVEEAKRAARVLHEDVIQRIATLQEGLTPPPDLRRSDRRSKR